jgi:DNA-binding Lrp family transcriptional regulator
MASRSTARHVGSLVDVETGQRFAVTTDPGPGATYGKRFLIMFDEARHQIIKELRNAATLRVFLALPDHLSWTEFRPLNQGQLASELEIDQASVSRAMKDLLNRGIVEREGKGPASHWRLSLKWGWRGNAAAYHAAVRETEAARQRMLAGQPAHSRAANAAEDIDRKVARPQRALTLLRRVPADETEQARN